MLGTSNFEASRRAAGEDVRGSGREVADAAEQACCTPGAPALVLILFRRPLPGMSSDLVGAAVEAPRLGLESGGSCHGLDVAVRAVLERAAVFRQVAPLTGLKPLNRRGGQHDVHRLGAVGRNGCRRVEIVDHG
jgi:hypothetical protein